MWIPDQIYYEAIPEPPLHKTLLFIPTQQTTAERVTSRHINYRYAEFWGYKATNGTVNAAAVFLGNTAATTPWQVDPAAAGVFPLATGDLASNQYLDLYDWFCKAGTAADGVLIFYWP